MNTDFSLHYRSLVPSQMGQRVAGGGLGVTFVTLVAFSPLKLTGWVYFIITCLRGTGITIAQDPFFSHTTDRSGALPREPDLILSAPRVGL